MPAGPIGSCWAIGSWSDTAWEAGTWADAALTEFGDLTTLFHYYTEDLLNQYVPPPTFDMTTVVLSDEAAMIAGSGGNSDDHPTAYAYYLTGLYGQ